MIEKVRNNFKSRLFPIRETARELTPELAKELTKHRKSQLKLQQEFINEIIANENDKYDVISITFRKRHN